MLPNSPSPLNKVPEPAEDIFISNILNDTIMMARGETYAELIAILGALRGLAILHQTGHWQSSGPTFYSDHLLLQRVYETADGDVDGLAERIVGLAKGALVGYSSHVITLTRFLKTVKDGSTSDDPCRSSLEAERFFLGLLEAVMTRLEQRGLLTRGLEQTLGTIAERHEVSVYLLKQRCAVNV